MGCICPKCKSNNIIPIMYGYPAPEAVEEAEKANLKLGCCEYLLVEDNQTIIVRNVKYFAYQKGS